MLSYCLRHADKAVALNAASTLDALVKDLDFVASDLTPGFDGLMEGIFIGLGGLESSDGRLVFLQLMSTLMNTVRKFMCGYCIGNFPCWLSFLRLNVCWLLHECLHFIGHLLYLHPISAVSCLSMLFQCYVMHSFHSVAFVSIAICTCDLDSFLSLAFCVVVLTGRANRHPQLCTARTATASFDMGCSCW